MLSYTRLNNDFATAAQIEAADVALVAAGGYRMVVNNRPDGEVGVSQGSVTIGAAARRQGLEYIYLPVSNDDLFNTANLDAFEWVLARAKGPVFAHCRSGTRTSILWALLAARHYPVDQVLASIRAAGLDLDFLAEELGEQHRRGPVVCGPVPAALALHDIPAVSTAPVGDEAAQARIA